jgi:hypothetical protein
MGLTSFSQETVFPIKGKFQVENDQNLEKRIFNEVQIESNVFHLMKNGEIMESYRLDHTLDRGFHVVQYFQDNVKRDQKRMDWENRPNQGNPLKWPRPRKNCRISWGFRLLQPVSRL